MLHFDDKYVIKEMFLTLKRLVTVICIGFVFYGATLVIYKDVIHPLEVFNKMEPYVTITYTLNDSEITEVVYLEKPLTGQVLWKDGVKGTMKSGNETYIITFSPFYRMIQIDGEDFYFETKQE